MMRIRDSIDRRAVEEKSAGVWDKYKTIRNRIVKQLKIEKEKYLVEIVDKNKGNSRKMWKNIKAVLPGNFQISPDEIIFVNKTVANDTKIAEKFNVYFIESIGEIITDMPKSLDPSDYPVVVLGCKLSVCRCVKGGVECHCVCG